MAKKTRPRQKPHRIRGWLDTLENRVVPANFTVLNAADAGAGSLRQAILDANGASGADTITFDAGFFNAANPRTITLTAASGQLSVTDDVTITGPGPSILTVSGGNAVRVFNVDNTATILNVTMSGMTITGGNGTTNGTTAADGGGINTTNENLTLDNVVISGNSSGSNDGGGLDATSTAFITIRNSTISGNTSGKNGGGLYFFSGGALLMENCTVSGNSAVGTGPGGGGIYFFGTVSAGGVTIRNSTIAGNTTNGSGGGVVLRSFSGTALIQNSTITGNTSNTTSTTVGYGGGGIALSSGSATSVLTLDSTIVSGNTAAAANGRSDLASIAAAIVNANFCAIGDADGFTLSGSSASNLATGAVLNLLPLASNGGPTQTVALGVGSPAVNAGANNASLSFDQRGTGFPRVVGAAADIGAFEGVVDQPSASGGPFANVTTSGGTTYTFTVTYSGGTAINVSTLDNNDIRVTGPNGYNQLATFVSVTPAGNGSPRTATYSITAPGGTFDAADNGTYTIALQAGQVANTGGGTAAATTLGTFTVQIAAVYTVTNLNDAGAGSLRQAITDSNATAGVLDAIVFQSGLTGTITLTAASGQLNITDSVTITGPGASALTINGNNAVRIFNVNGTGILNVTISGMTITGGNGTSNGTTGADGGGISTADENLTLDSVVITGNSSGTNDGGGLTATSTAFITIRNSTISGNTSGSDGGGVYFFSGGGMLMENSIVTGNVANSTGTGGGGIYFFGTVAAGGLTIRNSTIAGNTTNGSGGGIALPSFAGTALIQNCTITGNTSNTTSTAAGAGGGGIAITSGSASSILTIDSSIVSGNAVNVANTNSDVSTIAAAITNVNFSAIGDPDGYIPSATSGNNLASGAALNLLPLGNNGGPTQTIGLGQGSAAVNAGRNSASLTTDQRGTGFPRVVGAAADIGAFEGVLDQPLAVGGPYANVSTVGGTTYTFTVTYSGTTPVNVSTLDNNDIRVTGPNSYNQLATFVSVAPAGNGSPRTATYSITAPGGTFGGEDNGLYTIALQSGQVANTNGGFAAPATLGTFRVQIPTTYTVTNLNDTGVGSLRQAILDANANSGVPDNVVFQPGLTGTITLTLASGQLNITDSVTITGPGSSAITVSGGAAVRVFNIGGTGILNVNISGLTITGGRGIAGAGSTTVGSGGGILNTDETLTLDGVVLTGNSTTSGNGGGLHNSSSASVTIRNSTISGNTASGNGGGVNLFTSGGSLQLLNSTVSGNTASGTAGGGGVYFFGTVGAGGVVIRNSTISGNTAANTTSGSGGGLKFQYMNTGTGQVFVQNCTITGNTASGTDASTAGLGGGGIAWSFNTSSTAGQNLTIQSSIVSGNTAANATNDMSAAINCIINAYNSAIGDANGYTLSGNSGNLAFGAALGLGSLANNGGPTQTIAFTAGSLLRNAGSNPGTLTTDQRGVGFLRVSGAAADIGAFEFQDTTPAAPRVSSVVANTGPGQRSRVTSITVTFNTQVAFLLPGSVGSAFVISRIGGGTVGSFTGSAATVGGVTVVTLTNFTGAETVGPTGSTANSLVDGRYQVTVLAAQVSTGGQSLDGDGNGTGGDNYVLNGTPLNGLLRYYGDIDGDGDVDGSDLFQYVPTLFNPANYAPQFDFDGDGDVDGTDLFEFVQNLFVPLP
ncbi:MAG: choice-of-anchor Q domain-containing protein [Gemmataceae bacterium]